MNAQDILKKYQLSVTDSRLSVLQIFMQAGGALSHSDIESRLKGFHDRVTVYRTLQTFAEKGIIHQIPTIDNAVLYALCKEDCTDGHHHDNHVHFLCTECEITTCLDEVVVPAVKLPRGFRQNDVKMIVTGVCKSCK
ncbi:MAG TPA: transcriptional repressor [Ferruginibacter sp.]|nr:transcriptional repressor [Ferruginibacter sp.]HRO16768.1 transcriptional repressor [Ferruginibacter sp.]HRQ20304.1 transcriptional repressor [Ferruginibacter sp.]